MPVYGLGAAYESCTCPDGYFLVPGQGGAAPTCMGMDASWPMVPPRCASSGAPAVDADAGISGRAMLAMGLGALVLVVVLAR